MNRMDVAQYADDLDYYASLPINWSAIDGRRVAISGATGMIGAFLIDVLMWKNKRDDFQCDVLALGRNRDKALQRLPYWDNTSFAFERVDIGKPGSVPKVASDVVIHLASTTHPLAYTTEPVSTITSNVFGLKNLLDYSLRSEERCGTIYEGCNEFVFASSVEIYGRNRGDVDKFAEDYCGYIDSNTLRAGYPEAKRLGESLCQAYARQYGVRSVVPRLARVYGPTLLPTDSKALSQFLHRGLAGEDIVLKSDGTQMFSYVYVGDAVSALLRCMIDGQSGEAYNVADTSSDVTLRDLAGMVATACGVDVVFETPDTQEAQGYSTANRAVMSADKLRTLGWSPKYDICSGISHTLQVMRCL